MFTNPGNSGNGDDGIDCYTKGRFALLDLNYNSHQKVDYYSVVAPLMSRNDFQEFYCNSTNFHSEFISQYPLLNKEKISKNKTMDCFAMMNYHEEEDKN